MINVVHGHILGFCADIEVRYAGAVSRVEVCTMMVRVTEGRDDLISPRFMVFKNGSAQYLIQNVLDNAHGIAYHTGSEWRKDATVMCAWLRKGRVISALASHRLI